MDNKFRNEFIRRTGRVTKQWGLGDPIGRIWGLLLFENKHLTQKQIANQLNCSLSLVSPGLTLMENLGFVSVTGRNGREKQYGAVPSFIVAFDKLVRNFIDKEVNPLVKLIDTNLNQLEDEETKKRFQDMLVEYKQAGESIKMLSKFIKTNGGN